MAADNSPPRIKPIAITAFVAVLALVGLKFAFDSYYVVMFESEEYRKVGSVAPTELLALHAAEKQSLASAPIPIDRAMSLVAKGRAEPMAELKDGGIVAEPSADTASIIGWAQLAKPGATVPVPAASGSASPATSAAPAGSTSASGSFRAAPPAPSSSSAPVNPGPSSSVAPRPPLPVPPPQP